MAKNSKGNAYPVQKGLPERRMIIGIDGNEANTTRRVGIGQYAFQVLKGIHRIRNQESGIRNVKFKIYLKDKPLKDMPEEKAWWSYDTFGPKKLWTQIALPLRLLLKQEKPDIFFSPTHYAPRFAPCPRVIAIMDLSYIRFPELFTAKDLGQLTSWTGYSVKKAAKIFTISEFSRNEIISHYGVSPKNVIVTYPGYNKKIFQFPISNSQLSKKALKKFGITGNYVLFVGTIQPRKNVTRLVEAFERVHRSGLRLVIAGKKGWQYEPILERIEKSPLKDSIIIPDFVTDEELAALYNNARCFVLPSLYEGFGIPVIEAMACGCPAVVSNSSSLAEIAGGAAVLVDPDSVASIADGITAACFDGQKRRMLKKKGLARAKEFSWEKCSEKTLAVLQNLV